MKYFLSILSVLFITAMPAFANEKKVDPQRSQTFNCDSDINSGATIFCDAAPQIRRCVNCGCCFCSDYFTGCYDNFCAGFSKAGYDETTMEYVAVKSGSGKSISSCWKYQCRAGFIAYGSKCITAAQCNAMSGFQASSDGTKCETSKWCDDSWKSAYNPAQHDPVSGTCNTFKCKAGGCFGSSSGKTCSATDVDGTFGGTYADSAGMCKKCDVAKYVSAGGTACADGNKATKLQMKDCFECTVTDKFNACINTGDKSKCGRQ